MTTRFCVETVLDHLMTAGYEPEEGRPARELACILTAPGVGSVRVVVADDVEVHAFDRYMSCRWSARLSNAPGAVVLAVLEGAERELAELRDCPASPDALHHAEPRFCVETGDGWHHLMRADEATDAGLDVDRVFCPEHDAPLTEVPAPALRAEPAPGGGVWVTPVVKSARHM